MQTVVQVLCSKGTYERLQAKGKHYEMLAFKGLAAWVERFKGSVRG